MVAECAPVERARRQAFLVHAAILKPMRRRVILLAAGVIALSAVTYMVSTSSPTIALTLTRDAAIARAAVGAAVEGRPTWSRVESKLITYREWTRVLGSTYWSDPSISPDALFWVISYLGRLPEFESPTYQCEWVIRVFAADRAPREFGATMCGQGGWRWEFAVLADRAWWRLTR